MQIQGFDLSKSNPCLLFIILRKILRTVYHLLYHTFAWSYDLVAAIVSAGNWNTWVKETIPYLSGPNILEIGFGPGHLQIDLNEKGYIPFGIDESWQMIGQATGRLQSSHFQPRLARGISQQLPYKSAFDSIVSTFPSEYIFDPKTTQEMYRVLKPGGKLVILLSAVPNRNRLISRFFSRLEKLFKFDASKQFNTKLEEFIQLFQSEGFKVKSEFLERGKVSLLILSGEK